MNWIEGMRKAISYIEDNLENELDMQKVAAMACVSEFYFQKAFSILCSFTVADYVRNRRLTLAANELVSSDARIIDIAVKYGYDSADGFTKAFTRFHGVTPTAVRREGAVIKLFAPLKLKFALEGGYTMDYKIVKKEAFTIMGASRSINYESAYADIPNFWGEHCSSENAKHIKGAYGVCIESKPGAKEFEYLIADNYIPWEDIPAGCKAVSIPAHTWAVFPCKGPLPRSLQSVNSKIYSEWLPNCNEYEIAAGYDIELYYPPNEFPRGMDDESYQSEIWLPVKKKQS